MVTPLESIIDDDWREQQEQERDHARMVNEAEDALREAIALGLSSAAVEAIERITNIRRIA